MILRKTKYLQNLTKDTTTIKDRLFLSCNIILQTLVKIKKEKLQ